MISNTRYYLNRQAGVNYARNDALNKNPNWGKYESQVEIVPILLLSVYMRQVSHLILPVILGIGIPIAEYQHGFENEYCWLDENALVNTI